MDHFGGVAGLDQLVKIGKFWDRGLPEDPDAKGEFPGWAGLDDAMGKAYRKASAGKRKSLKPGDSLPFKGIKALVLASGGEVADRAVVSRFRDGVAIETGNRLCIRHRRINRSTPRTTREAWRSSFRSGIPVFRCRRPDLEHREEAGVSVRFDGPIDLYQVTHHGMEFPTIRRSFKRSPQSSPS